jgi:hypothetical protein
MMMDWTAKAQKAKAHAPPVFRANRLGVCDNPHGNLRPCYGARPLHIVSFLLALAFAIPSALRFVFLSEPEKK